ncbi:unnamed protein product [Adineta steineri]|uniref:Uncharacterized protein n=1 Tax=Adineta steineri TaxID=433720 RepID=A0A815N1E4_9BILA|nr:unnamed protein product [Adineta steineri]CAF1428772.1 unnamed protein product [Adineta steineri]
MASVNDVGLASTNDGELASTNDGGLASTNDGGLASTSDGGLASISDGGLVSSQTDIKHLEDEFRQYRDESQKKIEKLIKDLKKLREQQQFATPSTFDRLGCKGRRCFKCGECRDWYFTGDARSWKWIGNYENWAEGEGNFWGGDSLYECFKRRDGATCRGDVPRHLPRDLPGRRRYDGHRPHDRHDVPPDLSGDDRIGRRLARVDDRIDRLDRYLHSHDRLDRHLPRDLSGDDRLDRLDDRIDRRLDRLDDRIDRRLDLLDDRLGHFSGIGFICLCEDNIGV